MDARQLEIAQLAEHQHGVFRRDQARTLGCSAASIDEFLHRGVWVRVHERVYRVAGSVLTWRGELLAACWAGGTRAAASHRAAAKLWQLPGGREEALEIVCPRWRRSRHEGLVVHESLVLDRWDLRLIEGIPVTSPERTLLDLGAVCRASVVEMAFDAACRRSLVTPSTLRGALGRLGRRGRNGAGVLRAVLDARAPDAGLPESPMETRLLQVLRRNGLPPPVPQYEIFAGNTFVARVDAAYPQWRTAIEYESIEHHAGGAAIRRDSQRRNRLLAARWTPITATVDDIRAGGADLCSAVRAAGRLFLASTTQHASRVAGAETPQDLLEA